MQCPQCATVYVVCGDSEEGYARSICECEVEHKCPRCKRGATLPVNQAALDNQDEVKYYACAKHGHLEAEGFKPPAPPIGTRNKKKARDVEPEEPPQVSVEKEPPGPNQVREVIEHAWTAETLPKVKKAVQQELKRKENDYDLVCTNGSCRHQHTFSRRDLEINEKACTITIVCPKCRHSGYRILS
jgi:hypothetical protein